MWLLGTTYTTFETFFLNKNWRQKKPKPQGMIFLTHEQAHSSPFKSCLCGDSTHERDTKPHQPQYSSWVRRGHLSRGPSCWCSVTITRIKIITLQAPLFGAMTPPTETSRCFSHPSSVVFPLSKAFNQSLFHNGQNGMNGGQHWRKNHECIHFRRKIHTNPSSY